MTSLESFIKFEEEHNLFDLKFSGINYWQFIRFEIFMEIEYRENFLNGHPDFLNKSFREKMGFAPFVFSQFKHYFDNNQYDLLVSYAYIRKEVGGRLINPFIQYITDEYDFRVKNNTVFYSNWTNPPAGSNNALIQMLWLPVLCYSKLRKKLGLNNDDKFKNIIGLLNTHFGCNLSYKKYIDKIQQNVSKFKLLKRYYYHCITDKYKAIYFGCHYDIYNYALTAAAKKAGIPTIEHQHGVIGKYHIAYNFKDTSETGKYLPDYLFTFGDYWSETCRLPSYVKTVSVGSPQMDASKQEFNNNIKDNKTIVFISNGLIGPEMSKFAIIFADMAVPLGYRIIYKFHPNERLTWRTRYPWLAEANNIEPIDEPVNVHSILSTSQHIVSVASTVVFEALAFGCNVYIWNKQSREYVDDFINMGFAPLFDTEGQLLELVENAKGIDVGDVGNKLYKPGSIANVKEAFTKIMKEPKNEH